MTSTFLSYHDLQQQMISETANSQNPSSFKTQIISTYIKTKLVMKSNVEPLIGISIIMPFKFYIFNYQSTITVSVSAWIRQHLFVATDNSSEMGETYSKTLSNLKYKYSYGISKFNSALLSGNRVHL